jgi:NAD(P)-dependent dehydrogenase (short-subunit alcohol dehydrogenase family)
MKTQVVLITGASAGIGLSLAEMLMRSGATVYAASRRGGATIEDAASRGKIVAIKMDVNSETEIASTVGKIVAENGRLDAVACNAGNGISGAIEDTSPEEAKYQFETNFFGAVKCIQACLPVFREQGYGKILATSSVGGVVPIPFQAFYSASKSALLAFMNALSLEVKPFGIQCCSVLPGDTKTEFTAARKYAEKSQSTASAYYNTLQKSIGRMEKDEQNGMSSEAVASVMARQLTKRKMKLQVVPGLQYKLICWAFGWLPLRFKLWVVGLLYAG